MTLNELRYLVALARERHFGRAAEVCFVAQPTLSIAVKKLEEELGVAVFERHRHEVLITPAGERIVAQAERVLAEADALRGLATAALDEFESPLRLGAIFTAGPYLFSALIHHLKRSCPRLLLYLEENYTHVLAERLARAELDVIIVAAPVELAETRCAELFTEDFLLLLPVDHAMADLDQIDPGQLDPGNLLMLGEGHCFRDQVLQACPSLRAPGSMHFSPGSSLETLRHMVASGLGVTLIPASARPFLVSEGLKTLPVQPAPSRTMVAVWRHRFPRRRAVDALVEALRSLNLQGTSPAGQA